MEPYPHPNAQITTLSLMGLDQSFYFRYRAKLHLEPFFAVTVHCSDKQAISFCESSWQSPAFSTVQLHNALSSDQDWAKQGTLRLCTFTKAWREENSAERKVRMRGKRAAGSHLLSEMKVISFTKLLSVIFWEQVHNFFHTRAQAVFITLHYLSLAGPFGLQPKKMCYSLALPAI